VAIGTGNTHRRARSELEKAFVYARPPAVSIRLWMIDAVQRCIMATNTALLRAIPHIAPMMDNAGVTRIQAAASHRAMFATALTAI
jgi:hypothetical protein